MKHITWVLLLLAASLLTACEKEVSGPPYADTLKSYYLESTRLGSETLDSINNFVASLLFPLMANAYDVEIDGIYYNLVPKAKTILERSLNYKQIKNNLLFSKILFVFPPQIQNICITLHSNLSK